ncbi:uncharacterized protein LOC113467874, partial [Diaphorina citri]|uniref:Uncharacterized protein LOC113467874 n=1 Tax=Diaphorina citri TaxID=121845 RepID=A0A3Q0IZL1_DIACI
LELCNPIGTWVSFIYEVDVYILLLSIFIWDLGYLSYCRNHWFSDSSDLSHFSSLQYLSFIVRNINPSHTYLSSGRYYFVFITHPSFNFKSYFKFLYTWAELLGPMYLRLVHLAFTTISGTSPEVTTISG